MCVNVATYVCHNCAGTSSQPLLHLDLLQYIHMYVYTQECFLFSTYNFCTVIEYRMVGWSFISGLQQICRIPKIQIYSNHSFSFWTSFMAARPTHVTSNEILLHKDQNHATTCQAKKVGNGQSPTSKRMSFKTKHVKRRQRDHLY